jgi:hypothetical protein
MKGILGTDKLTFQTKQDPAISIILGHDRHSVSIRVVNHGLGNIMNRIDLGGERYLRGKI